jgi:GTP-binding protein
VSDEGDDLVEAGRKLFASPCEFIWAAARPDNLPPLGAVEIAFAGRSNVGKSSLLNALTGRKALARTSNTPGRTQELNFFALGAPERLRLVDMPGYGYAAVSKEKVASWTGLMHDFLRGRPTLARVYVLIDGRHGLKPIDDEMFGVLDAAAVSYQVVLTKIDEVAPSAREATLAKATEALRKRVAAFPEVMATSSQTGEGVGELRAAVVRVLRQRGAH